MTAGDKPKDEIVPIEFNGLTHQCNDPECHVAGFVKTLRIKAGEAEQPSPTRVCLDCGQDLRRSWRGMLTPTWVHPNGFASCVDLSTGPADGGDDRG